MFGARISVAYTRDSMLDHCRDLNVVICLPVLPPPPSPSQQQPRCCSSCQPMLGKSWWARSALGKLVHATCRRSVLAVIVDQTECGVCSMDL